MTEADPAVLSVRSLDTDWLLDMLTSMANSGDFSLAISLWTPGGIVSGDLIGSSTWITELRSQIRASDDPEGMQFADQLQGVQDHIVRSAVAAESSPEPLSFLHLRNATTLMPSGEVFRHGLWRGRFVDVTGWTLGKV